MEHDTAGDPVTGLKWTRKTTAKIADELGTLGIGVDAKTVGRILIQLGYSLRVNAKQVSSGSSPDRNDQFENIEALREEFASRGAPVLSVDTKKKELIGNFKNNGAAWGRESVAVNDHDFRSLGDGVAVPYGIYDVGANLGSVFIGTSYDTPEFAVDSIEKSCRYDGRFRYKNTEDLLILADCGGSNGYRCRTWKAGLQRLADKTGITIHVSHYPPGASKWNPIEAMQISPIPAANRTPRTRHKTRADHPQRSSAIIGSARRERVVFLCHRRCCFPGCLSRNC